jgi:hypothetical protein
VFYNNLSSMAAAGAMRPGHCPGGGIQWSFLCEAGNLPHWVMHPALHRPICMVIEMASNLLEFLIVVDFDCPHNRS